MNVRSATIIVGLSLGLPVLGADASRPSIALEDRVAAQKAIEQVYWDHRTWPRENPGLKPALAAVLSDAAIRAKVETYLRESDALDRIWRRPVSASDLQAELDRMMRDSRDPELLRELFAALGNDPALIAETLGRQTLVDRLVRNRYAADGRFHADAKRRAQTGLASCSQASCMKSMGGRYTEITWRRSEETAETWNARLDRWSRRAGALGPLEESAEGFAVGAVLAQGADTLTTATVVWDKREFEDWWQDAGRAMDPAFDAPRGAYAIAAPATGGCAPDNWSETALDLEPRQNATAVWTGSELIVWGGRTHGAPTLGSGGRYNPSTDSWLRTSRGSNVPTPRSGHTAVWTGTEMIVWGGTDMANNTFADGGRYNPSTDSWLPTSISATTPEARRSHTAVWTGGEMIVWGGLDYTARLNTGARYDPSTDQWQPISSDGAPSGRYFHTAVWTGSEMIVWGGVQVNAPGLNTGGRYNLSTDSWEPTSTGLNAPTGVYGHTAVWTGSRMIIWGGAPVANVVDAGGLYDPATDTWSPTSTGSGVPSPRIGHTAVWTGSEMIVWGGGGDSAGANFSSGGRYNPLTNTWASTRTQQAPSGREQHNAVWTGAEMIVWGGGDDQGVFNSGGRYSPSTNSWIATSLPITGEPTPRLLHSAVWTGSEMIVWGGQLEDEGTTGSGGRYIPATNSWTPTTNGGSPSNRYYHSAVWTGTEMIVWGGASGGTSSLLNTGARFNPADGTWHATAKTGGGVPSPRTLHVAAWTGTEMIVWGGREDTANANTGGRYNPVTNSWTATPTAGAPSARYDARGVWTGSELIVWGGSGGSLLNSGGRYNPVSNVWQPTSQGSNVPVPRRGNSAVWTGSQMIVWGGLSSDNSSTTENTGGIYDPAGDSWTPTAVSGTTPTARSGHTAVWTDTEMIVWGGSTGGRYNPSNDSWQPTSTGLGVPAPRYAHTAVWTGSEMIIWGGGIGGVRESGINVTGAGSRYCADSCASPATLYQDSDGDGYGSGGVSQVTCAQPAGWSPLAGDCNEANPSIHPGATESCNAVDDNCNGLVDEDALGVDSDGDGVRSACDVCAAAFDPAQSDFDHDGQGDLCDLDDGRISLLSTDKSHIVWQGESGPASWNVYEGDLDVLRASGIYTQAPGSNPLASKRCSVTDLTVSDTASVPAGRVKFALVTGVTAGVEGSLGTDGGNVERPNTNPCP